MGLGGEVVDFVGLNLFEELAEGGAVGEVTVVEVEVFGVALVRVEVDVFEAFGVEGGGAADDAVDGVAFGEEEFREVGAVLAGDAGDERGFFHIVYLEV